MEFLPENRKKLTSILNQVFESEIKNALKKRAHEIPPKREPIGYIVKKEYPGGPSLGDFISASFRNRHSSVCKLFPEFFQEIYFTDEVAPLQHFYRNNNK